MPEFPDFYLPNVGAEIGPPHCDTIRVGRKRKQAISQLFALLEIIRGWSTYKRSTILSGDYREAGAESESKKAAKAAAPARKSTIKQVVVDSITANSRISNDEMIAAVKAQFPKSAFDARHAAWYRSQARKGLLTGTPISIPPQTAKKQQSAKSDPE